ncbi:MAG: nucleotidyl transferase AbiEii/AbiGii toxin family protein [Syntrophales bacterium]|nr:nucleotidyl transferase AbiEii/AbiGii toxin family protein [Syntrophales bacterium]MDP3097625.1 nucleotidyl transferase AbiEii/AbiGii toxin family protein [Syntrophales bacterium]
MRDLIKQEQFEMEVLDRLRSGRFLDRLVFGGGAMLRLCYGLDRHSVDLDFWLLNKNGEKDFDHTAWFSGLLQFLARHYEIRDAAEKFHTLLIELKSPDYPRSLKLEMRKGVKMTKTDRAIAYSRHSSVQVYVRTIPLPEMMTSKIDAFLQRKEIRDAYDLEFLVKKGVQADISPEKGDQILTAIAALTRQDYNVKLCSLLEADQRPYYRQNNFRILKSYLGR